MSHRRTASTAGLMTAVPTVMIGLTRELGGIHFSDGDLDGRAPGEQIGRAVLRTAQTYFTGTAGA